MTIEQALSFAFFVIGFYCTVAILAMLIKAIRFNQEVNITLFTLCASISWGIIYAMHC